MSIAASFKTAWVTAEDKNVGEYLIFDFGVLQNDLMVTCIEIMNGFGRDEPQWSDYSRVKQFELYLNNSLYATINLLDTKDIQAVHLRLYVEAGETAEVKFVITDYYPGAKYEEVALTRLIMTHGI